MKKFLIQELKMKCRSLRLKYVPKTEMGYWGDMNPPELRMITPFVLSGMQINWIDTAYMVGDWETHPYMKNYLNDLVKCYGSGLFIFWAGFSEPLYNDFNKDLLVRQNFKIQAREIKVLKANYFPLYPNVFASMPKELKDELSGESHNVPGAIRCMEEFWINLHADKLISSFAYFGSVGCKNKRKMSKNKK